jgi:6-pyruvoyltetrahydropterin/6-carboxytetrahydropterin synthase
MHSLMVKKDFIASHYLVGGDWGSENQRHSHHYSLELMLEGHTLNKHNYLVDIVEVDAYLDELIARYRDTLLNEAPGFKDENPSIELFAKILCTAMAERIPDPGISKVKVVLWENDFAWAGYETSGR